MSDLTWLFSRFGGYMWLGCFHNENIKKQKTITLRVWEPRLAKDVFYWGVTSADSSVTRYQFIFFSWQLGKQHNLSSIMKWKWKCSLLSRVRLFVTTWIVAHQAPLSLGFSRLEYSSGLPFPSPGDLPTPGIKPGSPALQADSLSSEPPIKRWS